MPTKLPVEDRFWPKVEKQRSVCWLWTAAIDPNGYAVFTDEDGKKVHAHRWAYRYFVGPIPQGFQIDHLCRTKHCVKFEEHLRAVTSRVNTMAADNAPASINARKSHCKSGHELSGSNLYVTPNGRRMCRECQREREWKYRQKLRTDGER